MMKRITITLDEETYLRILDYSLERSKAELRSVSTSEVVRELLQMQIRRMGKEPPRST
jgi:predicted CopG family antitoxin